MRILLIGAGGQLAEDLRQVLAQEEIASVTHADLEIADRDAVSAAVRRLRPACILNTAAFNLVDACEERCEEAFRVNTLGPHHLARSAQQAGAVLVHFSTNYVFDGAKRTPYVETDVPHPLSVYGMSKLGGEWAVRQYCEKHFVIRTAALYGAAGNKSKGGNFIERMVKTAREGKPLKVVSDQVVCPTNTRDLAEKTALLIRTERYGLYHMVNQGSCSWFEFAREAFRLMGMTVDLTPTTTDALGAKARRPAYSALENAALCAAGITDFRPWQEALAEYLQKHSP